MKADSWKRRVFDLVLVLVMVVCFFSIVTIASSAEVGKARGKIQQRLECKDGKCSLVERPVFKKSVVKFKSRRFHPFVRIFKRR